MIRSVKNLLLRKWSLTGLACLAFVALFFWMRREAQWLEMRRERLELAAWQGGKPLRILHLSDLHASDAVPWSLLEQAAGLGLAERPDLILLTGDLVTDPNTIPDRDHYVKLLRRLSSAAPTFACLGNHDMPPVGTGQEMPVAALLREAGITLLRNTVGETTIQGQAVHLAGTGDLWSGDFSPELCLQGRRGAAGLLLLLTHNPDGLERLLPWDWDLLVCGHTHGGQLRLPLLGYRPLSPTQRHDHLAGLAPTSGGRLVETTIGVGNLHGLRFNCRPEIVILEIHAKPIAPGTGH
jgi:predicted MPP superfamily phosphohydrolase